MDDENAVLCAHFFIQLNEFVGIPVGTGRIDQSCGKAKSPLLHGLPNDGSHVLKLCRGRGPLLHAEGFDPDRTVAQQYRRIVVQPSLPQGFQVLRKTPPRPLFIGNDSVQAGQQVLHDLQASAADRRSAEPVLAEYFRSDALADFRVGRFLPEIFKVRMAVHIYKTGSNGKPRGVYDFCSLMVYFPHQGNLSAAYSHI